MKLDERGIEAATAALDEATQGRGYIKPAIDDVARAVVAAYLAEALRLRPMSEAPHGEEIILEDHEGYRWLGMVYFEPEGVEVPGMPVSHLMPLEHFRGWRLLLPERTEAQ